MIHWTVPSTPSIVLRADGLARDFDDHTVVSDVTFEVARGRTFGLLGPNGVGKTTTIKMLAGQLEPTRGRVELFGAELTTHNAGRFQSRIGLQTENGVFGALTVHENLRTWASGYDLSPTVAARRIDEVIDTLGLATYASTRAGTLSRGLHHRLEVGRAILHEPELLFLDEPTIGLDPDATAALLDHLVRLVRERGTTMVICTHQLQGLAELIDDVGIIVDGHMVLSGAVPDLIDQRWPQARYRVECESDPTHMEVLLNTIPGVSVDGPAPGGGLLVSAGSRALGPTIAETLVSHGHRLHALAPVRPTVQQLYFDVVDAALV